jgi:L-ascorbate metabolism protein UlaG (beta-lactamase superfamily)
MVQKYFSVAFLILSLSGCAQGAKMESDHYDGKRFYNEDRSVTVNKNIFEVIKWSLTGDKKTWPDWVDDNSIPEFKKSVHEHEVNVTFINHATVFLQFATLNVITDPVFSMRVSPFSWLGPKRHRKPGSELKDLPKIDIVILSHNHYDHLDLTSLQKINEKDHPIFIVPLRNKTLLESVGIEKIVELDWGQSYKTENGFLVTLVPMQHWSARGVFDRSEALWGGYVLDSSGFKVLFSGDTGYNTHFKEIRDEFGPMDVSLLPIGAYEPRWFMKEQHMNPEEAVRAHQDLQSKLSIAIHFGTFQLSDEGIDDPVRDLLTSLQAAHISQSDFLVLKNGQSTLRSLQSLQSLKEPPRSALNTDFSCKRTKGILDE